MRTTLVTAAATLVFASACTGIDGLWDVPMDAGITPGNEGDSLNEKDETETTPSASSDDEDKTKEPASSDTETDTDTTEPIKPPPDPTEADAGSDTTEPPVEPELPISATVAVDTTTRFQTLVGFGAAAAWYGDRLTNHPNKQHIYEKVFAELGLDVLRLRNIYRREAGMFDPDASELVAEAERSLGHPPIVLLSSWSPPADLKANAATDCQSEPATCTLKKVDGVYPYDEFGAWWRESLDAYAAIGVVPDYVSIQNEPDFTPPSWEGCRFDPVEGIYPGYNQALAAVRTALSDLPTKPLFVGPESVGLRYDKLRNYNNGMSDANVDALAHHLYDGDYWKSPDYFVPLMNEISQFIDGRPLFQTEFSDKASHDALQTAWLVHNALVEGNAAAYLYWELFWVGDQGLVTLESYHTPELWTTELGYIVQPEYYAIQHYAKYTDPGYVRVSTTTTDKALKASAFQAPDGSRTTVVLLNTSNDPKRVQISGLGLPSRLHRTGPLETFELVELDDESALRLDARGLATLVYE